MSECAVQGIHPSQVTKRVRALTGAEVAAIRDGILTQADVIAHDWTVKMIKSLRTGRAQFAKQFPEISRMRNLRLLHRALKMDEQIARTERLAEQVRRSPTELKQRKQRARLERRFDADMAVSPVSPLLRQYVGASKFRRSSSSK
jgi:hypothetical protein